MKTIIKVADLNVKLADLERELINARNAGEIDLTCEIKERIELTCSESEKLIDSKKFINECVKFSMDSVRSELERLGFDDAVCGYVREVKDEFSCQ